MLISTKGRYALRMMLELAANAPGELKTIKKIAASQGISEKYLEQIIMQLTKAGYVLSVRGAQGGYRLAMPPEDYTVGMILRLIEGDLSPVSCLSESPNPCPRSSQCVTVEVWQQIDEAVKAVVDRITLADLLARQKAKMAESPDDFIYTI